MKLLIKKCPVAVCLLSVLLILHSEKKILCKQKSVGLKIYVCHKMAIKEDKEIITKYLISEHIIKLTSKLPQMNFNSESIILQTAHLLMYFSEGSSHACAEAVTSWFRQSIMFYTYTYVQHKSSHTRQVLQVLGHAHKITLPK